MALIAVAYAIVFGQATVAAVRILLDPGAEGTLVVSTPEEALSGAVFWRSIAVGVALVAVVIALRGLRLRAGELGLGRVRAGFPFGVLGAFAAAYLASSCGDLAESLTGNLLFPAWYAALDPAAGAATPLSDALNGIGNAVSEELLLLGLPLAVAARLRWSAPACYALLVVLRLPFHLWHGPAAVAMVLAWMAVVLWVYRRVGSVWPFVVAHAATYVLVGQYPGPVRAALLAVSVGLVVLGVVAVVRRVRAERRSAAVRA